MRTTSRMIAALVLALGATGAAAQTPPVGGEGGSGPGASPPPAAPPPTPAAPPVATPPAATLPAPPAATPPTVPAPAAGAQPQQGTPATVLDTSDYESLLGRSVRSAQGDELGRVIDVIIDKEGHPRAAIIDFGGFLGVGTRKIAVDWRALRFTSDGKERRLSVALTRNQVRVSPEYKSGEPIVVLGPASGAPPEGGEPPAVAPAASAAGSVPPASQPPATQPPATQPPAAQPTVVPPPAVPMPEKAPDK